MWGTDRSGGELFVNMDTENTDLMKGWAFPDQFLKKDSAPRSWCVWCFRQVSEGPQDTGSKYYDQPDFILATLSTVKNLTERKVSTRCLKTQAIWRYGWGLSWSINWHAASWTTDRSTKAAIYSWIKLRHRLCAHLCRCHDGAFDCCIPPCYLTVTTVTIPFQQSFFILINLLFQAIYNDWHVVNYTFRLP